jgi:hypothetical protein
MHAHSFRAAWHRGSALLDQVDGVSWPRPLLHRVEGGYGKGADYGVNDLLKRVDPIIKSNMSGVLEPEPQGAETFAGAGAVINFELWFLAPAPSQTQESIS